MELQAYGPIARPIAKQNGELNKLPASQISLKPLLGNRLTTLLPQI